MTDASAKELLNGQWALEQTEIDLKRQYLPKATAAVGGVKGARYIQLEQKLRAVLRFELAKGVPLIGTEMKDKK
jgi:hypothetical protein